MREKFFELEVYKIIAQEFIYLNSFKPDEIIREIAQRRDLMKITLIVN